LAPKPKQDDFKIQRKLFRVDAVPLPCLSSSTVYVQAFPFTFNLVQSNMDKVGTTKRVSDPDSDPDSVHEIVHS
jgi:hypothetical protein